MPNTVDAKLLSRQYFGALMHADSQTLEVLLAADFWLIEPLEGWKVSRSTLLRDVGSGVLSFQLLEADSILVRSYDNVAIVIGSLEMKGRLPNSTFSLRCRFTHVFVRHAEGWKLTTAQETPIETWGKENRERLANS